MPDTAAAAPDDALDLDEWLDDLHLPETIVEICGDPSLVARFRRLELDLREQRAADEQVPETDQGLDHGAAARAIATEMDALQTRMRATVKLFRVRALTPDELTGLVNEHKDREADLAVAALQLQIVGVEERTTGRVAGPLTVTQVRKLRAGIGHGQFMALADAAAQLNHGRRVDVPFSYAASATLATGGSSPS